MKKLYGGLDIHKEKSKRGSYGKNFEAAHLREKDDSFVKNVLFHLLMWKKHLIVN